MSGAGYNKAEHAAHKEIATPLNLIREGVALRTGRRDWLYVKGWWKIAIPTVELDPECQPQVIVRSTHDIHRA